MLSEELGEKLHGLYSQEEVSKFLEIIKTSPRNTVLRVNSLLSSVDDAAERLTNHFNNSNSGFRIERSEHPSCSEILMIPSLGPFQVVPAEKQVVVDAACGSSVLRGSDIFKAGIIGMEENVERGDLVSVWVDLDGKCLKGWKKKFSGNTVFIGNGRCLVDRSDIFNEQSKEGLVGVGVEMVEIEYQMPPLNGVLSGQIFLQNLPSIFTAKAINPIPGSCVLDMCSSPGGKTCHLADLMNNQGVIVALDKNEKKVAKIMENCETLGVTIVRAMKADSTKIVDPVNGLNLKEIEITKPSFKPESFDFILLDPPCSGLGQRPNLVFSKDNLKNLGSYAPYQLKLFNEAWKLLKPGGSLVYSTCTVNPEENELLVDAVLKKYFDARLLPIRQVMMLDQFCLPGLKVGNLTDEQCQKCLCRFWPSDQHDSIGFFISKFEKIIQ